jgi:hypothetical protein
MCVPAEGGLSPAGVVYSVMAGTQQVCQEALRVNVFVPARRRGTCDDWESHWQAIDQTGLGASLSKGVLVR